MMFVNKPIPPTLTLPAIIIVILLAFPTPATTLTQASTTTASATVTQAQNLYSDIILSADARTRPIQDQSAAVEVAISASILSLLAVDEVKQSISLNLLIRLTWKDEIRTWIPSAYGGLNVVDVTIGDMWIPKLLNGNSVSKRDTFGTDYAPLSISFTGQVVHLPGGIMHTSCSLDMTYYPFDSQTCMVQLFSGSAVKFLQFVPFSSKMEKRAYIENPEWNLVNTSLEINEVAGTSLAEFTIYIQRKPGHFILTVLVPINIVSGLSSLVFLTPIESGERVSFSVTILLALSVYTSEVSKGLPNNSETVPLMVVYLACLLLHAAVAIMVNLIALMRHHGHALGNAQAFGGTAINLIDGPGRRKGLEKDCQNSDYISISEGQFGDLDSPGEPNLGQHGDISKNPDSKTPPVLFRKNVSSSSTKSGTRKYSVTSLFVTCAKKFNYGETDFRSTVAHQRGEQGSHVVGSLWLHQNMLLWLQKFVGLLDLVMFGTFFSAWVIITGVFMTLFNQG